MVKQVDVPTFSGHLGILREHVPTIAMLQPGVLAVHGETTQRYFGKKMLLLCMIVIFLELYRNIKSS